MFERSLKGKFAVPLLALIWLSAAAPASPAVSEAVAAPRPTVASVPVFGANSTFRGQVGGEGVLIDDFFTFDNMAGAGATVHLRRPDGEVVGMYAYEAGAWRLEMIAFNREACGADFTMNRAGTVQNARNRCPFPFPDAEIETARADLDRARRDIYRPEYLVQIVFPEQ